MVERHAFLRGLTWLVPYDEEYNHLDEDDESSSSEEEEEDDEESSSRQARPPRPVTWPPKTYGHPKERGRALASRIMLKDCSCCFHKGKQLLFFAKEKPNDDATQLSFQIALVEMNPAAFRQAVASHKKRRQQRARERERRRRQRQRLEEVAAAAAAAPAEGGRETESSSVLIVGPHHSNSSSITMGGLEGDEEEEEEGNDGGGKEDPSCKQRRQEEEEDDDDDLETAVVPALFFRIDGRVYLVDHTSMESLLLPKVNPPPPRTTKATTAAAGANANANTTDPTTTDTTPPWASFKFPTVSLRIWLTRLSLSRLNATQPLVSAMDAISRGLGNQVWLPPPLHDDVGGGGGGGEAAVESFLQAIETFLQPPPPSTAWPMADASFLLQQAGRVFSQALAPVEHRVGKKRARALKAKETDKVERMNDVLLRLFPLRRPGTGGGGGGSSSVAPTGRDLEALVRSAEELTRELKEVVRERHREKLFLRTVRAPKGEEPETPMPGAGEEEDEEESMLQVEEGN